MVAVKNTVGKPSFSQSNDYDTASGKTLRVSTGYTPRPLQAQLHSLFRRFNVIVCHRRFGKTVSTLNEIADWGLKNPLRNPRYAYMAPTYKQAKRIAWKYMLDIIRRIPGATANKQELSVTIPRPWHIDPETGLPDPDEVEILLLGADDPDSIRGIYLDGVVIDEYAQCDPSVWGEVIRPALADRKKIAAKFGLLTNPYYKAPWAIFIGTPKGQNHFFHRYNKALERSERARRYEEKHDITQQAIFWADFESKLGIAESTAQNEIGVILNKIPKLLANQYRLYRQYLADSQWYVALYKASETGILGQDELDDMLEELSEEEIEQELECSFTAAIMGSYFGHQINNLRSQQKIGDFPYDPSYPVDTYWDIGIGDKCTIWFLQKIHNKVYYINYFEDNGEGIQYYKRILDAYREPMGTRTIIPREGKKAPTTITGEGYRYGRHVWPHDGKAKEFGTGKTRQEQARNLGLNVEIQAKQSIEDRIDAARVRLKSSYFDNKCKRGLDCLYNYQKEYDEQKMIFKDKPKHDWASHAADSFGYSALDDRDSFFPDDMRRSNTKPRFADSEYDELSA